MTSKDPKMSKQDNAGKRRHVRLIPQKLRTIGGVENDKS
jgi:hypothetical protein